MTGPWDTGEDVGQQQTLMGRIHLATLVMQRVKQLADGARPRVERSGHKNARVALNEVLAGAVSWSVQPAAEAAQPAE
jgi:DNA-directed RNA polymerase subunit K/omega